MEDEDMVADPDRILQRVADELSGTVSFDEISYDGDGMILIVDDGVCYTLTVTAQPQEPE